MGERKPLRGQAVIDGAHGMSAFEPNRWLKLKTKLLIKACGGLEEASAACKESCREYSVPHLSRCQRPERPNFLPIDIVLCLESYCGLPIVTAAMAETRPAGEAVGSLRDETADVIERGGDLFKVVRAATADGQVDPREGAEIGAMLDEFFAELHQARQALTEALRPKAAPAAGVGK